MRVGVPGLLIKLSSSLTLHQTVVWENWSRQKGRGMEREFAMDGSLISKDTFEQILSHIDNSLLLPTISDTRDRAKENKDWERAWNEESALWAAAVCGPWVRGKETAEEVRIGRAWLVLAQDHPHHILCLSPFTESSFTSWHQSPLHKK